MKRLLILLAAVLVVTEGQTTEEALGDVTEEVTVAPGGDVTMEPDGEDTGNETDTGDGATGEASNETENGGEEEVDGGGGDSDDDGEDVGTLLPPPEQFPLDGNLVACNKEDAFTCNVTNLERCVLIRERAPRCVCLSGYARGSNGYTCIAVKSFRSSLRTYNPYSTHLLDSSSIEYRRLEFQARDGIFQALMASKLRTITTDVRIIGFEQTSSGEVIINYEIKISRAYAPDVSMVQEDLKDGIKNVLKQGDGGQAFLDNTTIIIDEAAVDEVTVKDPDPCENALMNYCDKNAICTRTSRSFICTCPDGFEDVSANILEAPGEQCQARCMCKNNGECVLNDAGNLYCKCPSWYLGARCEIDGQVLLIVLCCVLGVLFLIGIILGACYLCKVKRLGRRVREDESLEEVPRSESDMRSYKVARRPWMEDWKYYTHSHMPYPQLLSYWNRPMAEAAYTNRALQMAPVQYANTMPTYPPYIIPRPHAHTMRGPPPTASSVVSQPVGQPRSPRTYEPGKWYWESRETQS